jgi:hypothetical protein
MIRKGGRNNMPSKKDQDILDARIKLHRAYDNKHHELMNKANAKARNAHEKGDSVNEKKWNDVSKKHVEKVMFHQNKEYELKQKLKRGAK